ncbi:MAG: serine/threonine protein kinase, partial [Planctomycetota bacterium]
MPPPLLAGRYALQGLLGQGATGRVHRARDLRMQREVAVKLIRPSKASAHARARLEREAKIAARLQHEHVARVFDHGVHEGNWFIVQELVEGESLEAHVRKRARLRVGDVLSLGIDLAQGLAAIHALGILHRDLKPDNVILGTDGAKLVDFGVARAPASDDLRLTREGSWVGTPLYVAPEALLGEACAASDVFGLGAILFFALTGDPPHVEAAGSVVELVSARLAGAPSARPLREDTPPALDELLASMLAPRAPDRPALPDVVARLVALRAQRAPRDARRSLRRWAALAGVVAAAFALFAAGVAASLDLSSDPASGVASAREPDPEPVASAQPAEPRAGARGDETPPSPRPAADRGLPDASREGSGARHGPEERAAHAGTKPATDDPGAASGSEGDAVEAPPRAATEFAADSLLDAGLSRKLLSAADALPPPPPASPPSAAGNAQEGGKKPRNAT